MEEVSSVVAKRESNRDVASSVVFVRDFVCSVQCSLKCEMMNEAPSICSTGRASKSHPRNKKEEE